MENPITLLTISDVIQLVGILISLITSVAAIIISVRTLKQNNQMIVDSSRPYLVVYSGTTNFQTPNYYLILKNFGQSGAIITDFYCSHDLSQYSFNMDSVPFEHIVGTFVAPGQALKCNVDPIKLYEHPDALVFKISYEFSGNKYSETFPLNIKSDSDLILTRASTKDKELKIISYSLQDIAEKML